MQYKTIALELLRQRPKLYNQLRKERDLPRTLIFLAQVLRISHLAWKDRLLEQRPDSQESQVASEALEIALQEMENSLPPELPLAESDPLSLDGAMAFIRRHTPPA